MAGKAPEMTKEEKLKHNQLELSKLDSHEPAIIPIVLWLI